MQIVVVGGSGLVARRLISVLGTAQEVVSVSRSPRVDAINGEGSPMLLPADALVDVATHRRKTRPRSNPSPAGPGISWPWGWLPISVTMSCCRSSVVDRLKGGGYFRAKQAQEVLIRASSVSYMIVRSTLFFELIERMLALGDVDEGVRMPPALAQPVASDNIAEEIADIAAAPPLCRTIEMAVPETIRLDELARLLRAAH